MSTVADGVVFEMQIEQEQYSDVNPIVHYHVSDGTELTIVATLDDLGRYLDGEIEERCLPSVAGITIKTYFDQGFTCIGIDHPETEHTIIRTRSCADDTCARALQDYWL
jgi:hypothetical protein